MRGEEGSEYEGGEGESSSDEEEEQLMAKKAARSHLATKEKVNVCQPNITIHVHVGVGFQLHILK